MLNLTKFAFFMIILMIISKSIDGRKSKRNRILHQPPSLLEDKFTEYLPTNSQVTTFLNQGLNKTFYIWSNFNNSYLSITTITCTSDITWSLNYNPDNSTNDGVLNNLSRKVTDVDIYSFLTQHGLYTLKFYTERSTFVNIYVSTVIEFPFDALKSTERNIKLTKRRRKRLAVHWNPSLVDPHVTNYCLVVNTKKSYKSLCSAQCDNSNFASDAVNNIPRVVRYRDRQHTRRGISSPKITCVGKRNHYTLTNLERDQNYFIDLFAINQQTNLTYPFGSSVTKFDTNIKPLYLKDGKLTFINLKKLDGKAELVYKMETKTNDTLEFYIMPCGVTNVEVVLKYNATKTKTKIKGFGKLEVKNPKVGVKYFMRIVNGNYFGIGKASGVKVLATTKSSRMQFPILPPRTEVHEYISMRKCDSITIGWHASPIDDSTRYCITVKKGNLPHVNKFDMVDNCRVEYNLKSLGDHTFCKQYPQTNGSIITETLNRLNPGESYIVYVTIRKKKGRSLCYDLLQAYTRSECNNN